ncbi:hypothetical protein AB6A40_010921 [Gnathostoma spinigerum]|uniref:Uncharacterized protein n=1 Tax=Gnathostoma spinigerum TaxID=75299 RepID=A0ABD6F399_9BILA
MSLTSTTFGVVVLLIPPLVLITVHFIDISEAFYPDTQFQFFDVINDETTAFYGQEIDYESSEKKRQKEVYNSDGAPISDDFNISLLDDSATVSSKCESVLIG